jgi:YjbE family integral membrane protein
MLMPQWLGLIGGIILVDLVLSGDNALVIGAAASGLPRKQRWPAIAVGGAGAIILRVVFAVAATFLLELPLLQAIGGALLLIIALRLLADRSRSAKPSAEKNAKTDGIEKPAVQPKRSFFNAMVTILVADATMSLDNILAVGAIADGRVAALALGLLGSIALILLGSALVSELIKHLPWLLDAACLVLAWTAGKMMLDDNQFGQVLLSHVPYAALAIPIAALVLILAADIFILWRGKHKRVTTST